MYRECCSSDVTCDGSSSQIPVRHLGHLGARCRLNEEIAAYHYINTLSISLLLLVRLVFLLPWHTYIYIYWTGKACVFGWHNKMQVVLNAGNRDLCQFMIWFAGEAEWCKFTERPTLETHNWRFTGSMNMLPE